MRIPDDPSGDDSLEYGMMQMQAELDRVRASVISLRKALLGQAKAYCDMTDAITLLTERLKVLERHND